STAERTTFELQNFPYDLRCDIAREEFEDWTARDIAKIEACVDELFEHSSVDHSEVDKVFLTGGTSLVPRIRRIFSNRFGEDKIDSGGEFTSVASGLALRARDLFG
ncbi:MAG: Hsp70 family protein, partial [Pseudomonadota bacterium]